MSMTTGEYGSIVALARDELLAQQKADTQRDAARLLAEQLRRGSKSAAKLTAILLDAGVLPVGAL